MDSRVTCSTPDSASAGSAMTTCAWSGLQCAAAPGREASLLYRPGARAPGGLWHQSVGIHPSIQVELLQHLLQSTQWGWVPPLVLQGTLPCYTSPPGVCTHIASVMHGGPGQRRTTISGDEQVSGEPHVYEFRPVPPVCIRCHRAAWRGPLSPCPCHSGAPLTSGVPGAYSHTACCDHSTTHLRAGVILPARPGPPTRGGHSTARAWHATVTVTL